MGNCCLSTWTCGLQPRSKESQEVLHNPQVPSYRTQIKTSKGRQYVADFEEGKATDLVRSFLVDSKACLPPHSMTLIF